MIRYFSVLSYFLTTHLQHYAQKFVLNCLRSVSYTHLDVYKRQVVEEGKVGGREGEEKESRKNINKY